MIVSLLELEGNFDTFRTINEVFRHVKQLTKKTLINKVLARFLGLQIKSDNTTKSKAMKCIDRKILPDYN